MAMQLIENDPAIEKQLRDFAQSLSEKDRRRFAAIEATQRGHGGVSYVARLLGCSVRTIERGIKELDHLENDPAAGRVRRPGAGRKKGLHLSRLKRRT
ncbi:MAG: hypothetical protein O3C17_23040 [Planctomycetota bacterium]|nr:hypothetical protein [Planctomycetota bacterium]